MNRFCRFWAALIALGMITAALGGCARTDSQDQPETLNVYATFYPLYACAEMITADVPDLQLSCLVQPQDGCLRDYQLSDWDYALLQRSADLVIAGGRGLESFESALYSMGDAGPAVACVLYNMEFAENPQTAHIDPDRESHFLDPNPHIYMCIDGMISIAESICAQMTIVDPENAGLYQRNLESAKERLNALSAEMHEIAGEIEGRKAVIMNEALTYIANEYDLNVVYSVDRDSGEAFRDTELRDCIESLAPYRGAVLLIEKQAPEAFVEALRGAGFTVALLDVLSTHSAQDGADGYFDAQRCNAQSLAEAYQKNQESET